MAGIVNRISPVNNRVNFGGGGSAGCYIRKSFSPVKCYKYFKIYGEGRGHIMPRLTGVIDTVRCMIKNIKLKVIQDETGSVIGGYTYKLRRGRNFYIDTLARTKKESAAKKAHEMMDVVYRDIKETAINKKAEEITLKSFANPRLKKHYESLGLKETREYIEHYYQMRALPQDFYNK